MGISGRQPGPGLIFHSDRGSEYTSRQFGELLASHSVRQSLCRPRQCWDNAVVESFYSTLKTELIHRYTWATRAQAGQAIFEFIEVLSRYAGDSALDVARQRPWVRRRSY